MTKKGTGSWNFTEKIGRRKVNEKKLYIWTILLITDQPKFWLNSGFKQSPLKSNYFALWRISRWRGSGLQWNLCRNGGSKPPLLPPSSPLSFEKKKIVQIKVIHSFEENGRWTDSLIKHTAHRIWILVFAHTHLNTISITNAVTTINASNNCRQENEV